MRTAAKMKLFLLLIVIVGCNTTPQEEKATAIEVSLFPQEELLAWEHEIKLYQNSKWKANRETTAGVKRMSAIIDSSTPSTVADYKHLGDSIISEINILISECTMKGASHDNLHIFLEPLVIKAAQLEQTLSAEEGAHLTSEIEKHLQAYHKYFL